MDCRVCRFFKAALSASLVILLEEIKRNDTKYEQNELKLKSLDPLFRDVYVLGIAFMDRRHFCASCNVLSK